MELEAIGAPAHTRTLVVSLAKLADDRALASGAIVDVRKRGLVPMASDLQTAGVIHDMRVRAEIALAPDRIAAIRVEQANVAFEPSLATGGECCRDPGPRIAALIDTPLDGDSTRRLGAALGGPLGCSHVLTLAQLLLSTAQTALALEREVHGGAARPAGQRIFHRSLSIDGVLGRDGLHLALQQADVHFVPLVPRADTDPLERLGARADDRPLLDALLNLAPTLIQCVPALMERWQSRPGAPRPGMMAGGGMADSCYMWRTGGALQKRLVGELAAVRSVEAVE